MFRKLSALIAAVLTSLVVLAAPQPVTTTRDFNNPSPQLIKEAAELAGGYLVRAIKSDGKFTYLFDANTNRELDEYNILRHAGSAYSMLELYELNHKPELKVAAKKALIYLLKQSRPALDNASSALLLVENKAYKTGANGLAVVALSKYQSITGEKDFDAVIKQLALGLLLYQRSDGSFISKVSYPQGKDSGFVSAYYPGEAILGLMRLYQLDHDARWLKAAERGADYLIDVRDQKIPAEKLPHDHWLLYALNELHKELPNPKYVAHTQKIVTAILSAQLNKGVKEEWRGGYDNPPRSSPTATRNEGLLAAYQLLTRVADKYLAQRVRAALKLGNSFQLRLLFWPEIAAKFPGGDKLIGGVRESATETTIRIDTVQHNLSSWVGYLKL